MPDDNGEPTQRPMTQLDDFRNTLQSVNKTLGQMAVSLAELKTTAALSAARVTEDRVDQKASELSVDLRLSKLESFRSRIQGQVALLGFLIGVLAAGLVYRFLSHP